MPNNIVKIVIMLGALNVSIGCAHTRALEQHVAELNDEVKSLKADRHDACMLAAEMSTVGTVVYLGEDTWYNRATGKVAVITGMERACLEAVDALRDAISDEDGPRRQILEKWKSGRPPIDKR